MSVHLIIEIRSLKRMRAACSKRTIRRCSYPHAGGRRRGSEDAETFSILDNQLGYNQTAEALAPVGKPKAGVSGSL